MQKVAVRRINEWDGPAMLKIYAPYALHSTATLEETVPDLQDYIRRIDKYTYGYGWIMCEIDSTPAGFCHLTENTEDPDNLFTAEIQLYVREDCKRRGVGSALLALMTDIMTYGNKREIVAKILQPDEEATAFFTAKGFIPQGIQPAAAVKFGKPHDVLIMKKQLAPIDPDAERPTKPYLIENADYEAAREKAAALVKTR